MKFAVPMFARSLLLLAGVVLMPLACTGGDAADSATPDSDLSARGKAEAAPPAAEGWISFRNGPQQLGRSATRLPERLQLLWSHDLGESVVATAAVDQGRVYVACLSGELTCFELRTGKKVWTYRSVDESESFAPGFKAAPTVSADRVYVGDEDGRLHAVDRATGKAVWTFDTGAEIVSGVTVHNDRLLFGSHDHSLYCLKAVDGTVVWSFETMGPVNCTPAVVEGHTFISGCDEHLRVINVETGKEVVDYPLETYLIASPAVDGSILYVGTYAAEIVAFDWKSKAVAWRYRDAAKDFPYHSSAAVTESLVIAGSQDKRLHAVDRKTGRPAWVFTTKGKVDSSPAVVGQRVFFGSRDGFVYEVDAATGKETWKYNTGPVEAGPAAGEGCLVIGSAGRSGTVYCFGAK